MSESVDIYGTAYGNFATPAMAEVRGETYGDDFGQSSWVTGLEYRRLFRLLELKATDHVLDVGCGSGGPALFLGAKSVVRSGVNERLLKEAGLELVMTEDVTDNEIEISQRWHDARERHAAELIRLEGEETFVALQKFLATVHILTQERRMSRLLYLSRKPRD